jgi:hypothetical protein
VNLTAGSVCVLGIKDTRSKLFDSKLISDAYRYNRFTIQTATSIVMPHVSFTLRSATCIAIVITTLATSTNAFSVPLHQRRSASTRIFQAQDNDNLCHDHIRKVQERAATPIRRGLSLLPQLLTGTVAVLTIAMTIPILPSHAGLLDEYGGGLTINPPTAKTTTAKTDITAATTVTPSSNGAKVQIDPTLRGCTYILSLSIYVLLDGSIP